MKKFLLGAVAAAGLALISVPCASAHWELRTTYRWRPILGGYVARTVRVWVPDPVVVAPAPPVVVRAPVVVAPAPVIVPRAAFYVRPPAVIIRP